QRSPNVATPLMAVTVRVPPRVPAPGLVPIAMVIEALLVATRFPPASCTLTCTGGLMLAPATVLVGWTVKASFAAGPTEMLNVVVVALVSEPLVATSVYPVPALSIVRLLKVATPLEAERGVVPPSVPPAGLVPMAIVIEALLPV